MSYPYLDSPRSSPQSTWLMGVLVFLVVGFVLIVVGLFLVPFIRNEWERGDPEAMLRRRMIEAEAEAEVVYRKRQAELKAEAEAADGRLAKLEIPTSAFRDVVAKAGPAVVNVSVEERIQGRQGFDRFATRSEGSGVIVRYDPEKDVAYVLTNSHVVHDPQTRQLAERLAITLQSGKTLYAETKDISADPPTDLAVVRVKAAKTRLVVAEFGASDEVKTGDWVVAIGSPFGLQQTVTSGIVSAVSRVNTRSLTDQEFIQTDAAINPGNSGGPLLDLKGRVVGINTAIVSRTGAYEGVGFAIPAKTAREVFEQLATGGRIVRGFLGIRTLGMKALDPQFAAELGVAGGVLIPFVERNTPAERGGLQRGDVVFRFEGTDITTPTQFLKLIKKTKPGTTVKIEVLRAEDAEPVSKTLSVTIGEEPPLN